MMSNLSLIENESSLVIPFIAGKFSLSETLSEISFFLPSKKLKSS